MDEMPRNREAFTQANTARIHQSAVRHFEVDWGGHLPATADSVARYLTSYAGKLSVNTLRQRLAALSRWHVEHGFVDPTRTVLVKRALKGIQASHPSPPKQAEPPPLMQVGAIVDGLEGARTEAARRGDRTISLRCLRDRALLLLGFWHGFRSDELIRLQVERVHCAPDEGMTCFLPRGKGHRHQMGTTYRMPALSRWCPVAATAAWVEAADLTTGPLFRAIDRWGRLSNHGLDANSVIPLLRHLFMQTGIAPPEIYSSHSLRRGFAEWATAQGWSLKELMEYVGCKDVHSAARYLDASDAAAKARIERTLGTMPAASGD